MKKPIMSHAVETQVNIALAQYANKEKFRRWGLDTIREQGSGILLLGPPGTGKTTIARYMGDRIKKGFRMLTVAEIGGGDPGETERNVDAFFVDCRKRGGITIFMDECDVLLMDRSHVGGDALTWMLGTTEAIMMGMNRYPGLFIAATNLTDRLDPALSDRFISIVEVGRPDFDLRIKLWKQKVPVKFPLQFTETQLKMMAGYDLSGRQIENVLVAVGSHCIARGSNPKIGDFKEFAEREMGKHIHHEK